MTKRFSERWLATLGAGAAIVFPISFIEALATESWSHAGWFAVAAAVSLGILVFALRSSHYVPRGATKNTQLQQSPPAIMMTPNPSIERTNTGKPVFASHLKRWASR